MRIFLKSCAVFALSVSAASWVFGAAVCGTSGVACETPGSTSQTTIVINASDLLSLQCLNSTGPNGNQTTSNYFFAVTTTDLGSSSANGTILNSGTGTVVVGVTPTHPASTTPGSTVTAGQVQGTKGGTSYWIYAQACPSGTSANGTNCSAWAKVATSQVTSTAYPTTVFSTPVKPTDATNNSINIRTAVPNGDVNNVSEIVNITVNDVNTSANSQSVSNITFTGNPGPYTINDTLFTNGFNPNTKYTYSAQVQYPWDAVPTAGAQTEGPFWTTPDTPGSVTLVNGSITHCSVTVNVTRSASTPTNPSYTKYQACVAPGGTPCATSATLPFSGSPAPADNQNFTIAPLTPNTNYQAEALALVGNGSDSTATGWNNSAYTLGPSFTTLSWGGTLTIPNVYITSVTFSIASLTGAATITSWAIHSGGSTGPTLASGSGDPTGTHTATGLTPNTQYSNVVLVLQEGGASCSSTLNFSPTTFTTTPAAPSGLTLVAPGAAGTLNASWTVGTGDPATTTYQVQYCLDSTFSTGCATKNVTNNGTSTSLTSLTEETTYFAHVMALTVGGGLNSSFSNSANAMTPNIAPVVPAPTCTQIGTSNSATCSVSGVSDNDQTNGVGLVYTWDLVTPVAGTSFTPSSTSNVTSTSNSTTFAYPSAQSYTVRVTVTDHNGSGLSTPQTVVFNPGQIPTSITISPSSATLATGASTPANFFTAKVVDQNGNVINGQSVNWTVTGTGNSVNPASGAGTSMTAGATTGIFNLSATLPGASSCTIPVTIVPAQVLTTIMICPQGTTSNCPTTMTLQTLQSQQFTAIGLDQFGNVLPLGTVVWSTSGGSVNSAGIFSSQMIGSGVTLTATDQTSGKSGSIFLNIVNFDVSGAFAYPVPYKASSGQKTINFANLGSQASIDIFTISGHKVFHVDVNNSNNQPYPWNIQNTSGESVASGVYLYVIKSPGGEKDGKLIIIK